MNASRSACRTLPAGPEPEITDKSKSASLALLLTAGLAKTRVFTLGSGAVLVGTTIGVSLGVFFTSFSFTGFGVIFSSTAGSGVTSTSLLIEPSVENVTSVEPTATISPTPPLNSVTTPLVGEGIVTVALSVIMSTIWSSSFIDSPISTCHATISPSTTPSPISGNLKI